MAPNLDKSKSLLSNKELQSSTKKKQQNMKKKHVLRPWFPSILSVFFNIQEFKNTTSDRWPVLKSQ